MALIINGVCRYAVHQSYAGRAVVNIIDMRVDTTGSPVSREDALESVAGDIINNWDDHIRPSQINDLVCESVSWVDLDSANGSVGQRSSTSATTWPTAGGTESPIPFPGMVAMRILKNTTGGRQARKGRMYLCGFDEGKSGDNPNQWLPAFVSVMNTSMSSFLSGIRDTGAMLDVERFPVVVHTPKGATPTATEVTSYSVDPVMGTQRRRTRG